VKASNHASVLGIGTALVLLTGVAEASKVPVSFDPTLGAQPARTQQKLAALEAKLPATFALPSSLQTVNSGTLSLSFFPETLAQLKRAGATSGTMPWPHTPLLCAKHASFAAPATLLAAGAPPSCSATETSVRNLLADAGVCRDVEEPERYVLSYAPAVVDDSTTGSIEALIGLAGEGLSHHPVPNGLLPNDWVPTLRSVLWKIRRSAVDAQIAKAHASYAQALSTLTSQSACFDAAAKTSLTTKLDELDAELVTVTAHLDALAAADLATAQHELVCMAAHSRARAALPFPSLTRNEREMIAFWLGGIYWRMRGGGLMPTGSTQRARTYFLQRPFQRIAELTGGSAIGNDLGTAIYLNIFDGWGDWMDMGTTPGGQDLYEDLVQMTDRGRHQVADTPLVPGSSSAVKYLADRGHDTTNLVTGGLDMGPCYAYALGQLNDFRYADQAPPPYGAFIEGFTAIGEFCTGASMALGMAKTLLDGVPSGQPPATLCLGRTCGDDGCGGSCGSCTGGKTCSADGACVSACVPSCAGKTCGDSDGCGGTCGSCDGGSTAPPFAGAAPDAASEAASPAGCGCRTTTPAGPAGLSAIGAIALVAAALGIRARRRSL
jgi:MYXO-CTERM domain-containing protein